MSEENKPAIDSWDDFKGVYLKAEDIKEFPFVTVPINVVTEFSEGKAKLSIVVEYKGRERMIGINKTNQDFIMAQDIVPQGLIGKKLTFGKIKARNPKTNSMVDSFALEKIE